MSAPSRLNSIASAISTRMSRGIKAIASLRRWQVITIAVVGILILLAAGASLLARSDEEDKLSGLSAKVTRGPLRVTVKENGEIQAERRKVISNELRWPVIILDLVDEGTVVRKGQTIVHFECKDLTEAVDRQELDVTSSLAKYTQASENLKLTKEETANKVLKARRAEDNTVADRELYKLHDYPIKQSQAENAVKIAEQDLALAKDKLDFKIRVNKMPDLESPFSANDIKADELKVQRLENDLQQARLELDKLEKFEHPRQLLELDQAVDDAALALKRAELEAKNQMLIAKADEQAGKRSYEIRKRKLDEFYDDEKKLTVKAEQSGLVVYDTGRRRRSEDLVVAKGEKIQPRQQIMVIPDMSSLMITTKVYEAIVEKVTPGIPAFIRLDSRPGMVLTGKISKVAPLPNSQNRWLNPGVKVYDVQVKFDKPMGADLKPGMTAVVELVLAELKDVLSVPIAAVFTDGGQTVCYRISGGHYQKVPVEVGMTNDRRVEIKSGLAEGDEVLLARPAKIKGLAGPVRPAGPARPARPDRARPGTGDKPSAAKAVTTRRGPIGIGGGPRSPKLVPSGSGPGGKPPKPGAKAPSGPGKPPKPGAKAPSGPGKPPQPGAKAPSGPGKPPKPGVKAPSGPGKPPKPGAKAPSGPGKPPKPGVKAPGAGASSRRGGTRGKP